MDSQAGSIFRQFLLLMTLIALAGCAAPRTGEPKLSQPTKTPSPTGEPNLSQPAKTPSPTLETSQVVLFDEWPKNDFPNDAAKITATALKNNILTLTVVYQGGCQEHTFTLYAETAFLLSIPPQALLYLAHDSHGDTCTNRIEKLLMFDLTPLDKDRNESGSHPLLLRISEPIGGAHGEEPVMPLEWP